MGPHLFTFLYNETWSEQLWFLFIAIYLSWFLNVKQWKIKDYNSEYLLPWLFFRRTVQKEGPNKGRTFYCCGAPRDQQCGFFQWTDEEPRGKLWYKVSWNGWTQKKDTLYLNWNFKFSFEWFYNEIGIMEIDLDLSHSGIKSFSANFIFLIFCLYIFICSSSHE